MYALSVGILWAEIGSADGNRVAIDGNAVPEPVIQGVCIWCEQSLLEHKIVARAYIDIDRAGLLDVGRICRWCADHDRVAVDRHRVERERRFEVRIQGRVRGDVLRRLPTVVDALIDDRQWRRGRIIPDNQHLARRGDRSAKRSSLSVVKENFGRIEPRVCRHGSQRGGQ